MGRVLRKLRSMTFRSGTVQLTEVVFPEHANHYGTLFGGHALLLMAKAAFVAARGRARCDVVMARCSEVLFHAPLPLGSVLTLDAEVTRTGRTSMTVRVIGRTEGLASAARSVVLDGVFEMVAVDAQGRSVPLPQDAAGVAAVPCEA